ncbi:MAG: NAD-dependent succinate-semialdehyde dehydrogenase [Chitinophagales bacterium]|nr:NAD-dependent succinate-semialdehyde dehydrogenase [Chitinophagales bacterium]MDW8418162.1 NAD-dependent succinate-semialdehyde dehydrogenase [Chitinophagales bacterium]
MYVSVNPFNHQKLAEYPPDAYPDVELSQSAYLYWRNLSLTARLEKLQKLADVLRKNRAEYARLITLEMGKPLRESLYEIDKTLTAFDYYGEHAEKFLAPRFITTNASRSYVRYDPLGIIFCIMPWNFPFWQVFRFALPALAAGNVIILKHAPNVPQCAAAIENAFKLAGFADGIFKNYYLTHQDAAALLADERIAGLSFTGSDTTGSLLASLAGKHIKKCVMELGGNDAFIVLEDADLPLTIAGAVKSRSINTGQACNGAKRFLVTEPIATAFVDGLIAAVRELKQGDPLHEATQISPLARRDLADKVEQQVRDTIAKGAIPHYGDSTFTGKGNFVTPVVLTNVPQNSTAFCDEIFGPVWSVTVVKNASEAVKLANQTRYGLAASVWTKNIALAEKLAVDLDAGNVFINEIVKSDPRMPFGGIKRSGFGRELSEEGIKEFVNVKSVFIR